ncbi:RNA recognition motif-containing protein [Colletotrichum truncatum]|uniref:RNA recognition motif-containing protein n=1 Tax=Colletotrichum truncatum TaxID=5467 RepID=A0ACC3YS20_COLTU|nr:RNA recognition motif-containing protein [Colletotrichum truncatum]KAF6789905.1 RNA recognition motif-containing protein [Colletotrichum truncatum]
MADWPIALHSFGDIHYFYGPPTNNPPHHRFDKGSYVYLFENANDRRARIEIANQPGTDDQDAFDGFLDKTHVRYSYNHQCMVTLTVGETTDQMEWHLPTYDPHNQSKYHYKLHSLDIYFWKQEDALQFVNGIRRVLPPAQVEILDEPAQSSSHHQLHHQQADPVSTLVQQLEHVAVSDPSYGTSQPSQQAASVPSFAGPPTSAVLAQEPPASFVPMAYNPAAPAAPEAIRHREKTPPPEDGSVDPLAAAVAYDAQAPFSPGFVPPPGFQAGQIGVAGLPPPPPPPAQFGGPPPQPGLQRAATMPAQAVQGGLASPGLSSPYGNGFPGTPGLQPPPPPPPQQPQQQQQQQQQSQTPQPQQVQQSTPPPPTSQGTPPVTSPGAVASPPGGYSSYSYTTQQQPAALDYSVHQQVYRPTEQEAAKYKGYMVKQEPAGKLEVNAGRLERGVTGMLRKFEKKFG